MLRVRGGVSVSLKSACIRGQGRGIRQRCCRYCTKTEAAPPQPSPTPPQPTPVPAAPTPVPPKRSRGVLKVLGTVVLLAGGAAVGTVAYAKTNPEFRKQVESNWPVLVPIMPFLFNETENGATTDELQLGTSKSIGPLAEFKNQLEKNRALKPSATPEPTSNEEDVESLPGLSSHEGISSQTIKNDKSKRELLWQKEKEEKRAQEMRQKMAKQEQEESANVAAYQVIVSTVMESSAELTQAAIDAQKLAVEATNVHTQKLKTAIDDPTTDSTEKEKQWKDVVVASEEKVAVLQDAEKCTVAAQEELEKLKSVISETKKSERKGQAVSPVVIGAEENLKMLTYDLTEQTSQVVKAQSEAKILQEYHTLIEEGKTTFKKELESIVPDVKLGRKGKKLTEDELNSLIAHAHRRIEQLQRQLAEQQAMEQQRLVTILEKQKQEDESIRRSEVNMELDRQAGDFAFEQELKLKNLRRENEQEMRVQLRRQAAAHSDHLQEVLRIQAKEFEEEVRRHEALVREEEVDRYQQKMVECLAKLRGIEAAIEGHADLEKQAKKSHELWLACETFQRTIATGPLESKTMEDKLMPLANEVIAIKEATDNNIFVDSLAAAIPETALIRGVYNEESLTQQWQNVRKSCHRVAMIGEEGGSLFQYFLSFFQSALLFTDPLPPRVDEDVDTQTLDTCKILSYANYYVERGNLEQAVRYVNQLSGMSRHVAADWLKEAKLLLETLQAAEALSAHSSASGLGGVNTAL